MRTHLFRIMLTVAAVGATPALVESSAFANELTAFAVMPANTFSVGPTSGQFAGPGAGGNALPLVNKQPVQGISAVLEGPTDDTFYVMPDNGFGSKTNSADALLRIYAIKPDFTVWTKRGRRGSGTISPANFRSGRTLSSFDADSFIGLRDPDHRLGFSLVADQATYPNGDNTIPVAPSIVAGRLLTGADFDIESVRIDGSGHFWFGEEFGPFLVETDERGRVLRSEVHLPNVVLPGSTSTGAEVMSPQNPYLGSLTPNLNGSNGFEGMAVGPSGRYLYPLLEGTVAGDDAINGTTRKNLRISKFDTKTQRYTGDTWIYQLEADGTNIGDMTAINDHQFLVIERNGVTATSTSGTPFKKIFIAELTSVGHFVKKTELVDLMNIRDPHDLNADGQTVFTFPYVTIESVLPLDAYTLLVINDNNYPGTGGRDTNSDHTEFLKISLDRRLDLDRDRDCDRGDHDGRGNHGNGH
ncbi:MAG TPA: esterase-like activity of phytase family protein [Polyangiaceae bacterium]|nr:esterase-like activity of phytase family protein [Polyangiaceae bacterium]